MSKNIPKEHIVFNENPYEYVDHHEVKIGDTIINITSNQDAFGIYTVVKTFDENGNVEKGLEEIKFDLNEEPSVFNYHWYPDDGSSKGGKKKHKQTHHKRTRKQRSKSKSKSRNMKSKKYRRTKK